MAINLFENCIDLDAVDRLTPEQLDRVNAIFEEDLGQIYSKVNAKKTVTCNCGCGATKPDDGKCECGAPLGH